METVSVVVKKVAMGGMVGVTVTWRGVSVIGRDEADALAAFTRNTGMIGKPRKSK